MEKIILWHNPRCGKSRSAVTLLEEENCDFEIRKYLVDTPSKEELVEILKILGIKPQELMRKKEAIYKALKLKEVEDEDSLIDAMVTHPKLIERPIIIVGKKAVIARPIENLIAFLKEYDGD